MQRLKDKLNFYIPACSQLLALVAMLLLGACAFQPSKHTQPPALLHPGPALEVADVDVLAVSPAMHEFLERYILPYPIRQTRIQLLASATANVGVLGFKYDEYLTLTSTEAFEARSGNCIGYANMIIALARRAGIKASYQEVIRHPEWSMDDDTMLLVKHVNVVLEGTHFSYVMDASNFRVTHNARRRIIGDSYAKALYMNNLGAEALIVNDLPKAYAYMTKAIEIEPLLTDSWVNLGVVFGRNGQLNDAVTVFQTALKIDEAEYSAMSNLYEVYLEQGNLAAAQELQAKVERYRRDNPYYLLHLSYTALESGQYEESIRLLERAIRKKQDDHKLHFALAKTQYLSGEKAAAENSLMRARELAPQDMLAHYTRPLDELIAEEREERALLTR